jgi:hypothetical protein
MGRTVLRLCTLNPLTTDADIRGTLERLAAMPVIGNWARGTPEAAHMPLANALSHRLPGCVPLALACALGAAQAVLVTEEYSYGGDATQNGACRRAGERAKSKAIVPAVIGRDGFQRGTNAVPLYLGKNEDSCGFDQMSWSVIEGDIRSVKEIKRADAERRGERDMGLRADTGMWTWWYRRAEPDPKFQVGTEIYFLVPAQGHAVRTREKIVRKGFHVGDEFVFEVTKQPNRPTWPYSAGSPTKATRCIASIAQPPIQIVRRASALQATKAGPQRAIA